MLFGGSFYNIHIQDHVGSLAYISCRAIVQEVVVCMCVCVGHLGLSVIWTSGANEILIIFVCVVADAPTASFSSLPTY